jgi:hypothetical protein
MIVIARRAERAVAIQLDRFVAAQSAAPANELNGCVIARSAATKQSI